MQPQQSVCGRAAHAPMPARRPSGLLIVHAMLTLAVNVWLCGMTRVYADPKSFKYIFKIQPKIVGLYASIYGNILFSIVNVTW